MLQDLRPYIVDLDHVAMAVHSVRAVLPLYRDLLGGEYYMGGVEAEQGYRWVQFRLPGGHKLEFLESLRDDSFVAKFLRLRGEGFHHITFHVHHLEELVQKLKERGMRIVGENYQNPQWQEAFISPRQAHGTIIQLAQSCLTEEEGLQTWRPDLETLLGTPED